MLREPTGQTKLPLGEVRPIWSMVANCFHFRPALFALYPLGTLYLIMDFELLPTVSLRSRSFNVLPGSQRSVHPRLWTATLEPTTLQGSLRLREITQTSWATWTVSSKGHRDSSGVYSLPAHDCPWGSSAFTHPYRARPDALWGMRAGCK